jgi:hypothetical protein
MLEVLQSFEQSAATFSPIVLIGPGMAAVVIGLFIWLGGLGFRRLLLAAAGAASGWLCGFFLIGRTFTIALALACIIAVVAVIFEKAFMIILAAALAAVIGFVLLNARQVPTSAKTASRTQARDIRSSLTVMESYSFDAGQKVRQTWSDMPALNWGVIVLAVLVAIVAGFFLWRLVSAFCCAALGTTLIFAGMISLLLYKGSAPITAIYNRPSFYGIAFAAMTAFGTVEQLIFCRPKKEAKRKKRSRADDGQSEPKKQRWRTS